MVCLPRTGAGWFVDHADRSGAVANRDTESATGKIPEGSFREEYQSDVETRDRQRGPRLVRGRKRGVGAIQFQWRQCWLQMSHGRLSQFRSRCGGDDQLREWRRANE